MCRIKVWGWYSFLWEVVSISPPLVSRWAFDSFVNSRMQEKWCSVICREAKSTKAPHAYSPKLSCKKSDYPRLPGCKEAKPLKSLQEPVLLFQGSQPSTRYEWMSFSEDSSSQPSCQPQFFWYPQLRPGYHGTMTNHPHCALWDSWKVRT